MVAALAISMSSVSGLAPVSKSEDDGSRAGGDSGPIHRLEASGPKGIQAPELLGVIMSNLFWLTDAQMDRLRSFFPKSHGRQRVDDLRDLSDIIFINRNGLRWCDAPRAYGPPKTLCNRGKRWGDMAVFARMTEGLASEGGEEKVVMIDATSLKAHGTASSRRRKRRARQPARASDWAHEGWLHYQAACRYRRQGTAPDVSS